MSGQNAADVFARHLNLGSLRGRRRGVVRCIFHEEKTPSLSVDVDRGVFNCFGCGARGGVKKFRDLVGEVAPSSHRGQGHARRPPLEVAREDVLREARAQRWAEPGVLDLYAVADTIRRRALLVAHARHMASALGDMPQAWELLAPAAELERETWTLEAALDEVLA